MRRPLSAMQAVFRIARLTRKRMFRGKVLWIAVVIALVPVLAMALVAWNEPSARRWRILFDMLSVLLVVIPALLLAPWISEEVDDKTVTYLWSRPLPRWSLMVGKLLALLPVIMVLCALTLSASFFVMFGGRAFADIALLKGGLLGLGVGLIGWSAVAVGIGAIVPKYGTAIVIVYCMFLDTSIGSMPFSIQNLALSFHIQEISVSVGTGVDGVWGSMTWVLGLSIVWLGVAMWRVSVAEYAIDD